MTAQDFLSDREEVKNFMFRLFLLGRQVYLKYSMDEMSVYAAQASFFIIMAAFPFFMVLLALIQTAPMIHEADLLRFLLPAIPDRFRGLFLYLLDTLHSDSPAALISVTAVAAVWSASKGMLGIEKGLNRVFGVTSPRNYIRRRALCSVYTLVFSLMCVASLALLVFGSFLQKMLLKWIPALSYLSGMLSLCRGIVMFISRIGNFHLAIRFPERCSPLRDGHSHLWHFPFISATSAHTPSHTGA